jgi:hypothetical protein
MEALSREHSYKRKALDMVVKANLESWKAQGRCYYLDTGTHVVLTTYECALLTCEILGKMDHLRKYIVEKGMPEPKRVSAARKRH